MDPIDLERGISGGRYDRRSSAIRQNTNIFLRFCRICRSQGVFSCSMIASLFVLMSLIAVMYVQTGGGPSKSGFGCDLRMSPPHVSNRSVNTGFCEIHRPVAQTNKDLLAGVSSVPFDSSVRFFIVGDWGRDGWCCQRDVAWEMARAAGTLQPHFIGNAGDGFYEYGLLSENEEQVSTSWSDIYLVHDPLKTVPWYSVLGNHEYRGSADAVMRVVSVQPLFRQPARYYDKVFTSADNSVRMHMFFLDTSPMIAKYKISGYDDNKDTMINQPDGISTQWSQVETQLAWLDRSLNASQADVKVVLGHHPPYTSGSHFHEDDMFLRNRLSPILERNQVLAYFSGHDHNLQEYWRLYSPTHYIVSAGGSKVEGAFTQSDTYLRYFDQVNGFCAVEATTDGLRVAFVDYVGNVIRTVEILKQHTEA